MRRDDYDDDDRSYRRERTNPHQMYVWFVGLPLGLLFLTVALVVGGLGVYKAVKAEDESQERRTASERKRLDEKPGADGKITRRLEFDHTETKEVGARSAELQRRRMDMEDKREQQAA